MELVRPKVLREFCVRAGVRPERASGQHFLVHHRTLERIVDAVDPQPDETILEVGAGFGVLTGALASRMCGGTGESLTQFFSAEKNCYGRIIAIERDRRIVPILREAVASFRTVDVVEGDALTMMRAWHCGARSAGPAASDPHRARWRSARGTPKGPGARGLAPLDIAPPVSPARSHAGGSSLRLDPPLRVTRASSVLSDLRRWKLAANLPYVERAAERSPAVFNPSDCTAGRSVSSEGRQARGAAESTPQRRETSAAGARSQGLPTARDFLGSRWKLAANLPYSITSDFLRLLFDLVGTGSLPPPERAVLLLQREVVDRLTGAPGSMGFLTILTALHATARRVVRVPPSHFWPPPKVESAVVLLEGFRGLDAISHLLGDVARERFLRVVSRAFVRRRQQIRKSLCGAEGSRGIEDALARAGLRSTARPEELDLNQWIAVVREIV